MSENLQVACYTGVKTILRPVDPDQDLPYFYRWINDSEVTQYTRTVLPYSLPKEKQYLGEIGKSIHEVIFGILDAENGQLIGSMGLHGIDYVERSARTGALIGEKDYWGKGYGSDAKMLQLYHAFHVLNLHRISSSVIEFNGRSAAYLKKAGYVEEGRSREAVYRAGRYWDKLNFGILRSEFDSKWEEYKKLLPNGRPF